MSKNTRPLKEKVQEILQRVSPSDAYEMMQESRYSESILINHYRRYAEQRALQEYPGDYAFAELCSYWAVWVAGRALISGRRPKHER